MSLPIYTSGEDVIGIIDYLKTKPTGATIADAKPVVKKQLIDPRKITAYETWGFVDKEGDRLKLSDRGWRVVRNPKTQETAFLEALDGIVPYRSAIEWIHHQNLDSVTNIDVAAHWHLHHAEDLGTDNENTIKDQAVSFFRLAEAAGLGACKMGRRGSPTRLDIDKSKLKQHIESGPSAPPWHHGEPEVEPEEEQKNEDVQASQEPIIEEKPEHKKSEQEKELLKVFISHGKNTDLVDQVEVMLGLAEIESEVAVKEESSAIPVPDKVFGSMRRCTAGIIIVSAEEGNKDADGNYRVNENVLIEIGAAFVLYDRRVVLLWDKQLPVPSNLQGLYRCEFDGSELSWSAGMKLMKAIKEFKK